MSGNKATRECRTFETTTDGLLGLLEWLSSSRCAVVAMEATGVYWRPVWKILSDGDFELILANAAHIKAVPRAHGVFLQAGEQIDSRPRDRRRQLDLLEDERDV